jgi:asparagine synthase (glutamine-hydrolysing)
VLVPLSGGLDSRLVAAGLVEVGYRNVICFAYGRTGNFEAERSRQVAEKLGLPWLFVAYSPAKVRDFQKSGTYAEHYRVADTCASVPFIQDLLAIEELKECGAVPDDAVFVNGQSGDFITGNHVPEPLRQSRPDLDPEQRRARITGALIAKHFSLWEDLKTSGNLARITELLNDRVVAAGVPQVSASADYGVYELVECQERQSKFVISGQRVYDFFGHDWRLPLWDVEYMDFWERMPLEFKVAQNLYQEWLAEAGWGGVWEPLLPKRTIVPLWARYARAAASVPVKLFGNETWKSFDRKVFSHWTNVLCTINVVPWHRALFDRHGFRQGVAFRTELYLGMHGLSYDGKMLAGGHPQN